MKTEKSLRIQLAQSKQYLDIHDVALMTNFSVSSIRRKIQDGLIKALQNTPRGKLLFAYDDVVKFIEGDGAR